MWNIARSAEAMFSRWAVKRAFKFLLKKKLGDFILGDIDLDQLDVQLGAGTAQLSDLALNVDYINQKFVTGAGVIIKEGSIGSLLVKMPWKGKGCQIEVDELEVVVTPCMKNRHSVGAESCSGRVRSSPSGNDFGNLDHDMVTPPAISTSTDVHEGVKRIAKMVKCLLTSFHVKIKRLLVAFDPCLEGDSNRTSSQMILVLRIKETECGTCLSEDVSLNGLGETFLGDSRLTNFARFQGAALELLQVDEVDQNLWLSGSSGSTFNEWFSGSCPPTATIPILSGECGGFSGTLKLSIPWKNGYLDIRKVDSEVDIDTVELRLQPRTIKWLTVTWGALQDMDIGGKTNMHVKEGDSVYYNSASHFHSSVLGSSAIAADKRVPSPAYACVDVCSPRGPGLPGSSLISDWVPFSVDKSHKGKAEEADFGASFDQFFECFDEMRSSQSALGSSGLWNWTGPVFSAITAATTLASGSMQVPSEQQHVRTNIKSRITGICVLLSFDDENMEHLCTANGAHKKFNLNANFLAVICQDVLLGLQACPQETRAEATVRHIEVSNYFRNGVGVMGTGSHDSGYGYDSKTLFTQHIQAEVQGVLPPFASLTEDFLKSNCLVASPALSSLNSYACKSDAESIENNLVKVVLLTSHGVSSFQYTVSLSLSGDRLAQSVSFSLELPSFVVWVDFKLIILLLNLWNEVGNYFETMDLRDGLIAEASKKKCGSSYQETMRRGSYQHATASSTARLQGNVIIPNARVIFCFPFEDRKDIRCCPAWDQFMVLNFSSESTPGKKKVHEINSSSYTNAQKRLASTASHRLCFNVGNCGLYLVTPCWDDSAGNNFCSLERKGFSSHNVFCFINESGSTSLISMIWQEGPLTGPWLVKKAKDLAASGNLGSKSKVTGKGYGFASVTTMEDVEGSKFGLRKDMIRSSAFILHAQLPPARVNLDTSLYKSCYCLLNQAINELSSASRDALDTAEEFNVKQTSLFVECDSLEISIQPDMEKGLKESILNELPDSWHSIKLNIKKFELLNVSNVGGIKGTTFLWVGHGEGKLWGSVTAAPDQEVLLILCSNSTMRRGNGGGSNALSYRLAGSDIIHLWDPQSSNSLTSVTVSCGTILAVGGRLDWLEAIFSFFSLVPPVIDQPSEEPVQRRESKIAGGSCAPSFVLNLVDVGLSYEPYTKDVSTKGGVSEVEDQDKQVACILAAASLNFFDVTIADSISKEYKIRVQDLGLLISAASRPINATAMYNIEDLHKFGYVKVAAEAFMDATLRTNCRNGLLWELECVESHSQITLDTCQDTTTGLISLFSQLQQIFSPDVEESVSHLQARWNNVQKANQKNKVNHGTEFCNIGPTSLAPSHFEMEEKSSVCGLMDEICNDAFQFDGNQLHASDSELQRHVLLDGTVVEGTCHVSSRAECSLLNGRNPLLGKDCAPEIIESFYKPEMLLASDNSVTNQSLLKTERKSRTADAGSTEGENVGWYQETLLRIVENHISEKGQESDCQQNLGGKLLRRSSMKGDDIQKARGRILLKNINVVWKLHAGSDWLDLKLQSTSVHGRDDTLCLELAVFGLEFQYQVYPEGQPCSSKLSFSVQDFNLYDNSRDAPWKLVLGYYDSKEHPRRTSSKALKLNLEAVRPDPSVPLDEYRLRVMFLPILVHLHQLQLDFLISFFGGSTTPIKQSPDLSQESHGNKSSPGKCGNFQQNISEEALLPYFQKFDIWPLLIRVDYTPSRVDLAALRGGKYVELVNLVPWKGVELHLKHVYAVGVYGWSTVCETIIGDWLEDISQNQIHKLLQGLPTIRSLVAVGSGATKLVTLPVRSYKKDHRLLKGMQRGTVAFLKSISLEAVGLGLHLAAGAHDILCQAEHILAGIPPSVPLSVTGRTITNVRSNQPKDAQQGLLQACESFGDGLGRSASALVQAPLKSYQRGAGAGSALATAIRAAPAAAIAPASAAAGAVRCALLGVRNSLDPEYKQKSVEKYRGPMQSRDNS